jgi:tetratricopeptide (TPR) repeat protein
MLFDVRGRRKRLVQVVYVILAILFGGSLVFFGTGSGVDGGLADVFKGNGGDDSVFVDQYDKARERAAAAPRSPAAQVELVRASYNLAASEDGSDAETGALTDKGRQAITAAASAWERYLDLEPAKIDAGTAQFAALAFGALQDYEQAAKAQRIAATERPSANAWFQLALFYYRAGDTRAGDRAAAKSVRLTPKDQRNTVTDLIAKSKKEGRAVAKQIAAQRKQAREAGGEGGEGGGSAFGPLPGAGTTGSTGATP